MVSRGMVYVKDYQQKLSVILYIGSFSRCLTLTRIYKDHKQRLWMLKNNGR